MGVFGPSNFYSGNFRNNIPRDFREGLSSFYYLVGSYIFKPLENTGPIVRFRDFSTRC